MSDWGRGRAGGGGDSRRRDGRSAVREAQLPRLALLVVAGQAWSMIRHSALLSQASGLVHGFTTRAGPSWLASGGGLDLGPRASARTWGWVATQVGLDGAAVALLSQVHGRDVLFASAGGLIGDGDALVTDRAGLLLAVRVADCVPVLVAVVDADGLARAVAAVHAGWRGLAAGVIPAAVSALRGRGPWPGGAATRVLASVGPCIGADAYEVGADVIEGIGVRVPRDCFARPGWRPGHWQADLGAAAAWQLHDVGVDAVEVNPWCTSQDPALHSFRRDGAAAGRLAAVIGLKC